MFFSFEEQAELDLHENLAEKFDIFFKVVSHHRIHFLLFKMLLSETELFGLFHMMPHG